MKIIRLGDIATSNITFTLDSDLNGASPQFTLTCISTGGPATTVSWTRNSDTVTKGKMSVLDDRVTAQYTHTLTVIGRLGGLYTCIVTNNKPSHNSTRFTVQGRKLCTCYFVTVQDASHLNLFPLSSRLKSN